MKPLDGEQSAVFQKAIDHHTREANKEAQSGSEIGEKIHSACVATLNAALKELRPKPKFADGQLVYCDGPSYFGWYKVGNNPDDHGILEQSRPLNFTELGPEVMALRDAAWKSANKSLLPALRAFDAAHGGEAELQRQDAVIERLGGYEKFTVSKQGSHWICDRCGLCGAAPGDLEGHQCSENHDGE